MDAWSGVEEVNGGCDITKQEQTRGNLAKIMAHNYKKARRVLRVDA